MQNATEQFPYISTYQAVRSFQTTELTSEI